MNINLSDVVKGLSGVIYMSGSDEFFQAVLALDEEPVLEPKGSGFVIRFSNGYEVRLYEFMGELFGSFRDDISNNSGQVWNPLVARRIFNQVLEYLTVPTPASV